MTMIAIATKGDHAEILTDSARYNLSLSQLDNASKVRHFTHLDAAVVTQGDSVFGVSVKANMDLMTGTFDQLVELLPLTLPKLWSQEVEGRHGVVASTAYLVGYSDEAGEFRAYAMASDQDFEPVPFETTCTPMPWSYRPSELEVARLSQALPEGPNRAVNLERWAAQPPLPVPQDAADWVDLAKLVREQRALEDYGRVIVAGKVHLARLARGTYRTRVVHTYNDQGEELQQLLALTYHPLAQVAPCWCGSGEALILCHMAEDLDKPCPCASPRTFRECCAITTDGGPVAR